MFYTLSFNKIQCTQQTVVLKKKISSPGKWKKTRYLPEHFKKKWQVEGGVEGAWNIHPNE